MSSETASSSRCSSSFSSLSEHSNISGESLQEAKKRALKELETRFLRVKQYAKVTHERRKALQRNVKTRERLFYGTMCSSASAKINADVQRKSSKAKKRARFC